MTTKTGERERESRAGLSWTQVKVGVSLRLLGGNHRGYRQHQHTGYLYTLSTVYNCLTQRNTSCPVRARQQHIENIFT